MLEELYVRNFGGIRECELLLSEGLNVIIGETGAGKSLLLGAIGFLGGGKMGFPVDGSAVEAVFNVDGEELSVRREVKDGRSRFFLNGMRVPQSAVSERLSFISYQSQHSSLSVLKPSKQLEIVDRFGGLEPLLSDYRKIYSDYRKLKSELEKVERELSDRERLIDVLRFQIEEIERVSPKEGEEEEIERLIDVISKAEKIKSFREFSVESRYGDGGALERIGKVISLLEELGMGDDILEDLNDVYYRLEDVVDRIRESFQVPEGDYDLESLEDRLFQIRRLKSKYGPTLSDVEKFCEDAKRRLELLENSDFEVERLRRELHRLEEELSALSGEIGRRRRTSALKLEKRILENLKELGLKGAKFRIDVKRVEGFSRDGSDRVEFLFTGNVSMEPKPLSDSISGGELSRLLLSILSESGKDKSLMVFDEIDAGMSGRILSKVADKLRCISKNVQVIAVSHSPNVASLADRVFKVEKSDGNITVRQVPDEELNREIAIMIAGSETEGSLKAAEDLLRRRYEGGCRGTP